jgi:hypothetical protein
MSTYSLEQLLTIWKQDNMTTEQAVGHLLQHLALVYERLRAVERGAEVARQGDATTKQRKAGG